MCRKLSVGGLLPIRLVFPVGGFLHTRRLLSVGMLSIIGSL